MTAEPEAERLAERARRARLREDLTAEAAATLAWSQSLARLAGAQGSAAAAADAGQTLAAAETFMARLAEAEGAIIEAADADVGRQVRHDLRTPLSALKGYAELIADEHDAILGDAVAPLLAAADRLLHHVAGIGAAPPPGVAGDGRAARRAAELATSAARLERRATPMREPGRLLVVDDHETNRELTARLLRNAGHLVSVAASGESGLAQLRTERFDVVLLDLLMPGMNGLDVLEALQTDPVLRQTAVIVLTGLDDTTGLGRCLHAGAHDFIRKPFDAVVLTARVGAALAHQRLLAAERELQARLRLEKERGDALLSNILPAAVIERLARGERTIADHVPAATVVFADLVGFTALAAEISPAVLVRDLNRIITAFDALAAEHGLEKIKTVGDCYLAVAGLGGEADHAVRAARFARAVRRALAALTPELEYPFRLRAGLHSGPLVAGVIGRDKFTFDIWGDTVNVASRLQTAARPDQLQLSAATRAALGGAFAVEPLGVVHLRGRGPIEAFAIAD